MGIVHSKRALAAAAASLLLLAGCSDPQGSGPEAAATQEGEAEPGDRSPGGGGPSGAGGSAKGSRSTGDGGSGGNGGGDEEQNGGGGGGPRGSGGGGNSFARSGGGSTGYPAAGDYVFAQSGFERFCQGPSCSKEPLPRIATTSVSYSERSANEAVVVAEARSSEQQTLTTTTRYTPDEASITNVVVDFAYSGFNFAQTYEPRPPIEALRFPLGSQSGWQGRWKARTSGDYRVNVLGRESVDVGGTAVDAYRLETVTNFRGEFSGRAQVTAWVDVATSMVVKTDGDVAVASAFGEYTSSFRTILRTGPGY